MNLILANQLWPCSLLFINWLRGHLLPCPIKYLTGIDCPGCGFQRSFVALLHGNFHQSFLFYPATLPLLTVTVYTIADNRFKLDTANNSIKKCVYILTASLIWISYAFKMLHIYTIPS
ncbi:DUF2752 domain-containing protein [Mucilaginibacter koreensis]